MNRVEIYKDNKIKVEIDGVLNDFLENFFIKTIKLEKFQYNLLSNIILKELCEEGFNCSGCKIIMNSTAPIIEKCKAIKLIDDFQVLQDAFDYLTILKDRSDKEEIILALNTLYGEWDIPFYINFFEKPIFKIAGYAAVRKGDIVLIALFVYPD